MRGGLNRALWFKTLFDGIAKLCRVVYHGDTCILEGLDLGFGVWLSWDGESAGVAHGTAVRLVHSGYQGNDRSVTLLDRTVSLGG